METHLHELGKRWKYGVWIPHELSPLQLQHRVDACMEVSTSHRNYQWLRNLISDDQKWMLSMKYERRRQWLSAGQTGGATPKTDVHPKNSMLSVWWGVKGVIHWKIVPNSCSVTADLYCQRLDEVVKKCQRKTRLNLLFPGQCETLCTEVDTPKIIGP